MKQIRRDWNRFWFGPVSSVPLGLFRLVFGFWTLVYGLLLFPERFLWFSERGILPSKQALEYNSTSGPATGQGLGAGYQINFLTLPGADHFLTPLFVVYLLAALCLTLGFWTRTSAVLVYLGLTLLHNRDAPIHNSGDTVMIVLAIYLLLSPAGTACSLDRLWRVLRGKEDDAPPLIVPWAQRLMQVQIAVLYLCASLSKATGPQWMDGTATHYPLHLSESVRFPMLGRDNIYVINLFTWGTMVIEFALATFVWVPSLRLYVLAGGVLLHLGIEYTFNIPLFSFLMITSYINFLTAEDIQNFCRSALLVVRFLDVFRQITFVDSGDRAALAAAGIRSEDAEQAAVAVRPDGRQSMGFDAFRLIAWQLPATALLAPLLYVPPIPQLGRRAYAWVKDNRSRLPVAPRYRAKPARERETVAV
jgi:predicted DCC family thiol-disulfide oxidoreductase YuxK